jgi:catechol 2,3-dioxygenase-like lactoylglutathione lyase family enzyme
MTKRIHSILFFCKDLNKTAQFYETLDFTVSKANDAVRITFGDYKLAFMDENKTLIKTDADAGLKGVCIYIYFEVENVDAFYQTLKEKHIMTSSEPKDWPWGKREFAVRDPDGYKLIFFSKI